jgi:hypothetical protein
MVRLYYVLCEKLGRIHGLHRRVENKARIRRRFCGMIWPIQEAGSTPCMAVVSVVHDRSNEHCCMSFVPRHPDAANLSVAGIAGVRTSSTMTTPGQEQNLSHNNVEKIPERIDLCLCRKRVQTVRQSRLTRTRCSITLISVKVGTRPEGEKAVTSDIVTEQVSAVLMAFIAESSQRWFSLQTVLETPAKASTRAIIVT